MEAMLASGDHSNMSSGKRADFQKEVNVKFIKDIEVLELIGLADDPLTSTRSGITNGIKVAIAADAEDAYEYEAIIPFKSYRLSKASISTLGIGFETGKYVAKPPKNSTGAGTNGSPSQGYSGRGAGGYGAGGARGGGIRPSNYSNNPLATSTSLWTTVNLK
jgi:hypothetical protein